MSLPLFLTKNLAERSQKFCDPSQVYLDLQ